MLAANRLTTNFFLSSWRLFQGFRRSETSFSLLRIEIPPHMLSRPQRRSRLVGDFAYRFEVSSGGVWRLNPHPGGALGRGPAAPPAGSRQGGPTPPPHPRCAPGGDPRGPGIAAAGPRTLARLAALSGSRLQSAGLRPTAPAAEPVCRLSDAGSRSRGSSLRPGDGCPSSSALRT